MSLFAWSARHEAATASDPVSPRSKPLPVVWHTMVDIPLIAGVGRRTGLSISDAVELLGSQPLDRARAVRVLTMVSAITGPADWRVSLTSRRVRVERDGVPVEGLERNLLDHGFTYADFTVRVEYARAWGML